MDPQQADRNLSNGGDRIEAATFAPSDEGHAGLRFGPWHIAITVFVLLALFVFWFLFTSKSVQLRFTPDADSVSVAGGIAFELGGVYLLREGEYEVSATAPLHEPFSATIEVGDARNQSMDLVFVRLPGFLNLDLQPADGEVQIDGRAVTERRIELAAGEHEITVSHPRYISHAQLIEIEGKQIEQALQVTLAPNWSEVSVDSAPLGAEIWIDNEPSGVLTPGTVEALAGEREISVRLAGYKTHRERIFAQAGAPMQLDPIRLVQADAQLTVSSTPAGAGVTVNGRFAGQTPLQLDLKSSQQHTVQVIRNGYDTFSRRVSLERGEASQLHANLILQRGEVVIRAQPDGVRLSVDGKAMGDANQTLKLPIRAHQISLTLDGYAGYTQTITPKVGLTQEVKVKLLTLAEARLQALKPIITTSAGQNLKLFEPHAFTMGASRREPGRRANETLRDVDMSRLFYLSTMEVTNAQFRAFASGHDSGMFEEVTLNEDDMPVSSVGWHEAAAYCNWLSNKENLPPFYDIEYGKVVGLNPEATGYRLPTEAEWAWSARTLGDDKKNEQTQLRFPWGANLPPPDRHGNYADRAASALVGRVIFGYNDNHTAAAPVGTFKANHRGLFDMGGNVAEWINDFYEIPGQEAVKDPIGPASGDYRVIRGSSWMHGTITELRYSFRDYGIDGRQDVGFRLARYAE